MAMVKMHGGDNEVMRTAPISRGGQISIPAEVRRRWDTEAVQILDRGDHLEVRPVPGDPVAALRGSLPLRGTTSDRDRADARAEELERDR